MTGRGDTNSGPNEWTVEAREKRSGAWSEWCSWVDRATAEAEKANAIDLGYRARIVRSKVGGIW